MLFVAFVALFAVLSSCNVRKAVQNELGIATQKNPSKTTLSSVNTCHFEQSQLQQETVKIACEKILVPASVAAYFYQSETTTTDVPLYDEDAPPHTHKIPYYILYRKLKTHV
ncbi:hypothetical protein SAMN05216480_11294 [Pustulibacterium marinum]|uniref:Lipoprotein n=2 Tax=Pustulibacterium marinum TaxID=1224947 RepID=A0A1I7I2D3_9FLAO|nr:hypothetical protein SAMN05216480_11294 [Pustulibacterium marinum]